MGDRYAIDYYKAGGRSRACAEDFWIRKEKFTEAYVKLRVEFPWAVADLALVALPWGGFSWVSDPSRPVPEGLKRAHRAGLLCPDRKSERGVALAKAMAKLRKDHPRVHYKHFTADLFGGLIPKVDRDDGSYNVSYGLDFLGGEAIISAPEGCPPPPGGVRMLRSAYWLLREAAEQEREPGGAAGVRQVVDDATQAAESVQAAQSSEDLPWGDFPVCDLRDLAEEVSKDLPGVSSRLVDIADRIEEGIRAERQFLRTMADSLRASTKWVSHE